ncbi:hypothetical protein NCCP1664_20800 [Zafaria cholistanensis]|uniref:Anti-sigma K factor RskA C-terminal domain-containing protein n=2 Tax=Zafaria cholistanensis TaxID=1682741 RepID=A0A5A7NRZ4_9MICC|nr:hypothetical protein NCCP1664_20800 [Zafaria cholistanensis]
MENKDQNLQDPSMRGSGSQGSEWQETAEPDFDADVSALLGLAVAETPPPSLKRNVMAAIRSVPQLPAEDDAARSHTDQQDGDQHQGNQHDAGTPAPAAAPVPAPEAAPVWLDPTRRSRRAGKRRWFSGLALAASALLVATAGLGGTVLWQQNQQEQMRQQLAAAQNDAAQMRRLLEAPDLRAAQAQTVGGAAVVLAYSPSEGLMTVSGEDLPDAPEGHGYELWLISADGATPAGMMPGSGVALVEGQMEGVTHLGITVEPAAGSPQPTTEPILLHAL